MPRVQKSVYATLVCLLHTIPAPSPSKPPVNMSQLDTSQQYDASSIVVLVPGQVAVVVCHTEREDRFAGT